MTTSLRTRIATATAAVASLVALTFAIDSSASGSRGGVAAPTTVVPPATSLDPYGDSSSGSSGSSDPTFGDPSGSSSDPSGSSSDGSGDALPVDPSQNQQPSQDQGSSVDPGFGAPSSGTS